MSDIREKFGSYKASKTVLLWSWVGVAALTMIVGFTWGGWVTGGSAADRAETAAEEAVAALAADVCFESFMSAPDAQVSLTALKEESSYAQKGFVEKGGWTTIAGQDKPIKGAADLCADRLAEAELPTAVTTPAAETPVADAETPVAEVPAEALTTPTTVIK